MFVLVAPLYKGGNRALALMLLELAAVGLLIALAARHRAAVLADLPRSLLAALAILVGYPLLQLVPLPAAWWRALPGHAEYAAILQGFAPAGADAARPISLAPAATEYGLLALLPPFACLLVVRVLAPAQVVAMLSAMAVFAGVASLLGLLQAGAGAATLLGEDPGRGPGYATGTFVNRNHFAAMLAMMLPVLVGLLAYDARRARRRGERWRGATSNVVARRALLFASAVLVLLALLLTYSRAGIATALVGLALSPLLLARARGGGARANMVVATLVAASLGLAAMIALAPVLERFEPATLRMSGEGRAALYAATSRAALEFLPFGSGLATFAAVFPRFQGGVFGGFIDYAHNDYLQLVMEIGVAGVAVIALLVFAYASRMHALLRRRQGRSFTVIQVAAGIGLVPIALHSGFDFALHIPANAMWWATLAGVMLHPGVPGEPAVAPDARPVGAASP